MKVVIIGQALESLKDSLSFYLKEMKLPKEVVYRFKQINSQPAESVR